MDWGAEYPTLVVYDANSDPDPVRYTVAIESGLRAGPEWPGVANTENGGGWVLDWMTAAAGTGSGLGV